jgi:hypothetical protein
MGLKAALATVLFIFFYAQAAIAGAHNCWMKDNECRQYVGKRLWVSLPAGNPNVVEVTFTLGDWTTEKTLKLKSGASFLVTGLVRGEIADEVYEVKLNDGKKGWVATTNIFLIDFDPALRSKKVAEECARRGAPKIGMTPIELVETCWRKPLRIVEKTTAAGVEENYIYSIGHIVKFTDGKVSEIVEAR